MSHRTRNLPLSKDPLTSPSGLSLSDQRCIPAWSFGYRAWHPDFLLYFYWTTESWQLTTAWSCSVWEERTNTGTVCRRPGALKLLIALLLHHLRLFISSAVTWSGGNLLLSPNWSFHQRPNKCDAPPNKTYRNGARVFRLDGSTGFLCVGWTLLQKRSDVATKYFFFCSRRFVWFAEPTLAPLSLSRLVSPAESRPCLSWTPSSLPSTLQSLPFFFSILLFQPPSCHPILAGRRPPAGRHVDGNGWQEATLHPTTHCSWLPLGRNGEARQSCIVR